MKDVLIVTDSKKIKILAEKTRLYILSLLRDRPMTISELSMLLNKDPSTIHRHITLLKEAGFVEEIGKEGNEKLYGRSARVFLITPYENDANAWVAMEKIHTEEAIRLYELLTEAGFKIRNKKEFISIIKRFISQFETLSRDMIKKLEGVEMNRLEFIRIMALMTLINSPKLQEEAKKIRELLGLED
ncbi:winged helix-turn-helix domain-containing protein [Thermococcus sibiricus]|uniref:ArsR family transcriptional regulator n=1 Tax=Thermococcus sibiricus (strain DSM 12597 / MM 739) TaxID=604354 RepID=C6A036_THESM|nr:winged helix-turn-helix domain-containing protein [Thermococcus sibiricus]ACS91017.1 ArsR family transcriptional regulator [Thermococcus sibiricus MM 739]